MAQIKKLKYTKDEFIKISIDIYGDKFFYNEIELPYLNKKLTISCKKHGNFDVYGFHHITGKGDCMKCNNYKNIIKPCRIKHINDLVNENKIVYNFNILPKEKISVKCSVHGNNIISDRTFIKNKGCNLCNKNNKLENNFKIYKNKVRKITEYNWKHKNNFFNHNNYQRSHTGYHIDHEFSVKEGFENNIPPYIIGHFSNLRIIDYKQNIQKGEQSLINKDYLLDKYFLFKKIYG